MYDPEQYDKAGSNGNEVDEATRTRRNRFEKKWSAIVDRVRVVRLPCPVLTSGVVVVVGPNVRLLLRHSVITFYRPYAYLSIYTKETLSTHVT